MMPFYRYLDSYPNQRNQVPFPPYYCPSYDGIPPHMMVDQSKSPIIHEVWPHGSNYTCSMPCHTCGNHGNFPGYHHFSPSPLHYCGGHHHPPCTEQYPVHYPFPLHNWMEQPRYGFDRDAHKDFHCCGCPNHIHNQKDDKGVKIEEQESDVEKQSDSLVPFQLKKFPYPMVWIPPEYMKKYNEHSKPFELKVADQETFPHNTKSQANMRSSEKEPRVWNGWSPLDMNNLKSLMQDEDDKRPQNQQYENIMKQFPPFFWMPSKQEQDEAEKEDGRKMNGWFPLDANSLKSLMQGDYEDRQNQQNEDKRRQFPYPIFWMPPYNSEKGEDEKDQREANDAPISAEEPPYGFKFIPLRPPQSNDGMIKSKTNKDSLGGEVKSSQMKENSANQKNIPVKQVEVHKEDNTEESEKKVTEVTAKKAENIPTDNSSGMSKKRQSSSPPKMSKLPPVCLRLEPLPRKKNGNGCSRSPSPPDPKGQSQDTLKDTSEPSASSNVKENFPLGTKALDISLKKREVVEPEKFERKGNVVDGKTSEYKNDESKSGHQNVNLPFDSQEVVSRNLSTETTGRDSDEYKTEEDKGFKCEKNVMAEGTTETKKVTGSAESVDKGCVAKIKDLSDVEAATLIQSAYRAYEVRKLEPLKKLKQMAKVREQLVEVRNRIQALESFDLQKNDKERVVIGEMIMSLLLELDTIQGLHPSVREFRKALAKDLVNLQEKLDSLMMKRLNTPFEDVSTITPADDPNIDAHIDVSMQKTQNKAGIIENKLEPSHDTDVNMKEQEQGLLLNGRCESEVIELPVMTAENCTDSEEVSNSQLEGEVSHKELGGTQVITAETKERDERDDVQLELKQSVELPSISEEKTSFGEFMNSLLQGSCCDPNGEDESRVVRTSDGIDESRELPSKMIDGESAVSELEKNELIGEEKMEIYDNEMKSVMSSSLPLASTEVESVVPEGDNDIGADKDHETNLLTELPVGVIEDDLAPPAFGKHEEIETVKVEESSSESRFYVASNTTSPMEERFLDEIVTDTTSQMEETSLVEQHSLNVESGGDAKGMTEELPRNAALESEETEPLISTATEGNSDKVLDDEERDHKSNKTTPMFEAAVTSFDTPESDENKEDDQQQEPYGNEEEDVLEKKPQGEQPDSAIDDNKTEEQEPHRNKEKEVLEEEPEYLNDDNKMDELPHGSEGTKMDVLVATQSSPRSPRPREEYDMMMESDKKLIKENAELKEMMEKLMEAGKEQLSVISNLTGRVKDLERKLSKKKKLRTRHKKATASITKLHDNAMKERAVDVAM